MSYINRKPTYGNFILIFAGLKLLLNMLALNRYGFHRDELLHLALGDHLAWGYKEVPPFIGFLAFIVNHVLVGSLIATRIFPALFAAAMVWVAGKLVVEFGGRRFAIAITCLTLILSPAFVASDYLFQPVIFDQFWWVFATLLLAKFINTKEDKYLYFFGVAVGFGILTKYTMLFYVVALIIGLLCTRQRKMLISKPFLISAVIAIIMILPNIVWQLTHHIPAISHMNKLQSQQLQYNHWQDFVIQQFVYQGISSLVWLAGLGGLFLSYKLRRFMFLGIAYLVVFAFLLKMNGKSYYLFPAYPMLFAAGAYMIERVLKSSWKPLRIAVLLVLTLPHLLLLPIALPIMPVDQMIAYLKKLKQNFPVLKFANTWEDHKQHPLTQDYADMHGWVEMVEKSAKAFHALPAAEQSKTIVFSDNYGEAAAFFHYGPQYGLPPSISLNSSFALWAPEHLDIDNIIYISDDDDVSDLVPVSQSIEKIGEVTDTLSREKGTGIFLIKGIKPELREIYKKHLKESREN
ncbi:glycosyltransferase family 39 protein [Mucilaginibacter sp. RS28]|uniref:Glycosyltransferase family 39 protein n=1 Tax=Mucilaginibacter straminoryzae TaxID=2932774 RepID=A0A9X1X9U7_9SPHI|nr:glycosyltransferase family 39 protein [Mucilaginibacter straminoryzae]MCJ8210919.1 glycosyltransferase family 39 protein [Mucilaginibacter straminoryzae]